MTRQEQRMALWSAAWAEAVKQRSVYSGHQIDCIYPKVATSAADAALAAFDQRFPAPSTDPTGP